MTTKFRCGIYTASYCNPNWIVDINEYTLAFISSDGETMKYDKLDVYLTSNCLIELAVLMNNIKKQYKQLQTNS